MRYVIIGAGAVGGAIGGRLHQAGHDVVLVARGDHLAALRRDGLRLVTPGSEETLAVPAVAGPDDLELAGDDVLVLATKSQHTAEALGTWSPSEVVRGENAGRPAGEVLPVLCAQNGVANEPAASRWFARVAGVCVWLPASLPEPGTVLAPCGPLTGMLHLGAHRASTDGPGHSAGSGTWLDDTLDAVAADLEGARFRAPRPPDVMPWKRAKLVSNLGNAFDALFDRDGGWQDLLGDARTEARAVFEAAGWAVTTPEEEERERADQMDSQDIPGHPRGGGSTYQSLARGSDTVETDYLNGEIAAQGRLLGVPTPVNSAVQHLAARSVRERSAARTVPVDALRALL